MSTPENDPAADASRPKPPSLVPGVVLLVVAAILIVVVLVKPAMPQWLKVSVAITAVVVVVALLSYAVKVFRDTTRGNR